MQVQPTRFRKLTPLQVEILRLLAQGLIHKEIAQRLNISYDCAHSQISRFIRAKLSARTSTQAVATAIRQHLI